LPLIPTWLNAVTIQVLGVWQFSQVLGLGTWFAGLPVALTPL